MTLARARSVCAEASPSCCCGLGLLKAYLYDKVRPVTVHIDTIGPNHALPNKHPDMCHDHFQAYRYPRDSSPHAQAPSLMTLLHQTQKLPPWSKNPQPSGSPHWPVHSWAGVLLVIVCPSRPQHMRMVTWRVALLSEPWILVIYDASPLLPAQPGTRSHGHLSSLVYDLSSGLILCPSLGVSS